MTAMANPEHVKAFKRGKKAIEALRKTSGFVRLELSGVRVGPGEANGLLSVDLSDANISGASLTGLVFDNVNLSKADFRGAHLINCTLRNGLAVDADFSAATLIDCKLERERLQGACLDKCRVYDSKFDTCCEMADTLFHGAKLVNALFDGCWLHGSDFDEADFDKHSKFHQCRFSEQVHEQLRGKVTLEECKVRPSIFIAHDFDPARASIMDMLRTVLREKKLFAVEGEVPSAGLIVDEVLNSIKKSAMLLAIVSQKTDLKVASANAIPSIWVLEETAAAVALDKSVARVIGHGIDKLFEGEMVGRGRFIDYVCADPIPPCTGDPCSYEQCPNKNWEKVFQKVGRDLANNPLLKEQDC